MQLDKQLWLQDLGSQCRGLVILRPRLCQEGLLAVVTRRGKENQQHKQLKLIFYYTPPTP